MAIRTFLRIKAEVETGVTAIEEAIEKNPVDILAIRRELTNFRGIAQLIGTVVNRMRETWG